MSRYDDNFEFSKKKVLQPFHPEAHFSTYLKVYLNSVKPPRYLLISCYINIVKKASIFHGRMERVFST